MTYALFMALVTIAFLITLNEFLMGRKKLQIDALLSVGLIAIIATEFIADGWKYGLAAIVFAFLVAWAARPLAARLASRLLTLHLSSRNDYPGLPPKALHRIANRLQQFDHPALQSLLDFCESRPGVPDVMNEHHISRDDLEELYNELIRIGLGQWVVGHWVAASSLAYPLTLRFALETRGDNPDARRAAAVKLLDYFEHGAVLK